MNNPNEHNLSSFVKITTNRYGFDLFVPSKRKHKYIDMVYEEMTALCIRQNTKGVNTFIDIGAHYGFFDVLVGLSNPKCKILAFEPVPEKCELLRKNLELNNNVDALVNQSAVSDRPGRASFQVSEASDSSGFITNPTASVIKNVETETVQLDQYLSQISDGPVLIRIDTEGNEIEVLDGMQKIIEKCSDLRLVIAFNPKCLEANGKSPQTLLDRIFELGFETFFIDDEERQYEKYHQGQEWHDFMVERTFSNLFCIKRERSLNLCFFSHSAASEGAERFLLEIIDSLIAKYGTICTVVLPFEGPLQDLLEERGVATKVVNYHWWCATNPPTMKEVNALMQESYANVDRVIKTIDLISPDVILTNSLVIPWGAFAALRLNRPHIWFVHEFGQLDHKLEFYFTFKKSVDIIIEASNHIVVNSAAVRNALFKRVGSSRCTVATNKVVLSESKKNSKTFFRYPDSTKLVISGKVTSSKGQDDAVQAVKKLIQSGYNIELCIIGRVESPFGPALKALVKAEGLEERIHFWGFLEDVRPVIEQADINLTCSRYEAFGRGTAEAMLLGKPVIGTNTGGTVELIEDGIDGFLYSPGDVEQLAKKIAFFVEHPNKAREFGKRAREMITKILEKRPIEDLVFQLCQEQRDNLNSNSPQLTRLALSWQQGMQEIYEKQVREQEQALQALKSYVAEKEQAAQVYASEKEQAAQAFVAEKEQAAQAFAAEKEQAVQLLTAQVAEKEQAAQAYVAEKEQSMQALKELVTEKEQAAQSLTAQVEEITTSTAWRLVQYLWRMRVWLAPHGSWRERLIHALVHGWRMRGRVKNRRSKPAPQPASFDSYIQSQIEIGVPTFLVAGRGNYIYISGWCFHPDCRIRSLSLRVGESEYNIPNFGYARLDILHHYQNSHSLSSGFWTLAPIMPVSSPQDVEIALLADLGIKPRASVWSGRIHVLPAVQTERADYEKKSGGEPFVAICMVTDNPPLDLFLQQVDSLRNQTHTNWVCIVNDDCSIFETYDQMRQVLDQDERFIVYRNETRLGRYHNVERALERVPGNVEYVAFCDQDNNWYPEKLAASLQAFRSGKDQLVYSDMDVVLRDGQPVSRKHGNRRQNNYRSLEVLLFSNKAIGAVSIIRRSLVEDILPFPTKIGDIDHNHWVACVALSKGRIRFIDQPLYSYCQPGENAHQRQQKTRGHALLPEIAKIPGWIRSPSTFRTEMGVILRNLETTYHNYLIRLILLARLLRIRIPNMARSKRISLGSITSAETGMIGLSWQAFKYLVSHRPSLGYENIALRSYLSHHLLSAYYIKKGVSLLGNREAPSTSVSASQPNVDPPHPGFEGSVNLLRQGTAPVPLVSSPSEPVRVNIFMATINFKYVFGGYIAMFNLAHSIVKSGRRARIVLVEPTDYNPEEWKREIAKYPGIEDLFELVETSYQYDRSKPLPVNPADIFVATSCWTAHIAWRSAQQLGDRKIIFFAQEYEPLFFNAGSFYAFSRASYFLPQFTIFSSELLREYFELNRIGVYADSSRFGNQHSLVFENAINTFQVSVRSLQERKKKRFLFYARPEQHAARNLFELGIISLSEALHAGYFNLEEWEFYGIGVAGNMHKIHLDGDVFLTLLPKVSLQEYKEILPAYDLGMSLMLSPHPSLVPLEMAAAGMVTVTTTYENKTAEKLIAISTNLIGVPPTVDGLKTGLAQAVERIKAYEARISGAQVHWATNWEQAFNVDFMKKLNEFLSLANRPNDKIPTPKSKKVGSKEK